MRLSCVLSAAAPRSFLALASGCMVPLSVFSWLSSIGLTIRAAGAGFWAIAAVTHSNAPANTQRERKRRVSIVVFLCLSSEKIPLAEEKVAVPIKHVLACFPHAGA